MDFFLMTLRATGRQALAILLAFAVVLSVVPRSGAAQDESVKIPQFINPNTVTTSASTAMVRTIRFLTTDDFPPFNFIDQQGRLEGFNVALARALCFELKARCTMQALPWESLGNALSAGQGDAIIAGLVVSDESLRQYVFTVPYLRLPARFFAHKTNTSIIEGFNGPANLTVGVEAGTGHEAYLKKFFPQTPIQAFQSQDALRNAVRDRIIPLGFSDGVGASFWLQSSAARECCRFIGGAYLSSDFFGSGLSIAVPIEREDLKRILDDGLGRLMRKGKYAEIYLRFFPVDFF